MVAAATWGAETSRARQPRFQGPPGSTNRKEPVGDESGTARCCQTAKGSVATWGILNQMGDYLAHASFYTTSDFGSNNIILSQRKPTPTTTCSTLAFVGRKKAVFGTGGVR